MKCSVEWNIIHLYFKKQGHWSTNEICSYIFLIQAPRFISYVFTGIYSHLFHHFPLFIPHIFIPSGNYATFPLFSFSAWMPSFWLWICLSCRQLNYFFKSFSYPRPKMSPGCHFSLHMVKIYWINKTSASKFTSFLRFMNLHKKRNNGDFI